MPSRTIRIGAGAVNEGEGGGGEYVLRGESAFGALRQVRGETRNKLTSSLTASNKVIAVAGVYESAWLG